MALFSLTDIKIGRKSDDMTSKFGIEGGSRYENNTYRYPIDIGNTDKGHYMVIHVNQQRKTSYRRPTSSDLPTIFENRNTTNVNTTGVLEQFGQLSGSTSDLLDQFSSQVNLPSAKGFIKDAIDTATKAGTNLQDNLKMLSDVKSARTIERTTDTIALYMPDTVAFTEQQNYSTPSLGGGMLATLGSLMDAAKSSSTSGASQTIANLSPFVLRSLANLAGDQGNAIFAGATGLTVNPQMEMVYSSPQFRTFAFTFMFYPRSEKEAQSVQDILQRLKFHQAPEVLGRGQAGGYGSFFLVPPSEFDIKFYYNGAENPNIPKISTCVLTRISTDYTPNGWAAYEKPGQLTARVGGTGMPVGIRLDLEFQETEILTKANYASSNPLQMPSSMLGLDYGNTEGGQ
ncbi:MAG: hypothetical protein ACO239_00425 [Sediminibacterium sp.]